MKIVYADFGKFSTHQHIPKSDRVLGLIVLIAYLHKITIYKLNRFTYYSVKIILLGSLPARYS